MSWSVCESCLGRGKKNRKISKKAKSNYEFAYATYLQNPIENNIPITPTPSQYPCPACDGSGIIKTSTYPTANNSQFPHVSIIGLGIGGIALAVACLHRGIPFTIFEKDSSFASRSQGYGLTLQQASKALKALGIVELDNGIISTRHVVHNVAGEILGEWGLRKWLPEEKNIKEKRSNIHIARQSLRQHLIDQLEDKKLICWNHKFISYNQDEANRMRISFSIDGKFKQLKTDLIVGADGIRSRVRQQLFQIELKPLRYLGCIVILGICSLDKLEDINSPLLDLATVFQTANGIERIYVMPYSENKIMWQLSFPMSEKEAIQLSKNGPNSLKKEAIKRINWHSPIPDILRHTEESLITGYPVYDRDISNNELKESNLPITLIGDAAHPMSPFKGQGANQALLDALSLARTIYIKCKTTNWKEENIRDIILNNFEKEMFDRTTIKVKESAKAVHFLHCQDVLHISDQPRRGL